MAWGAGSSPSGGCGALGVREASGRDSEHQTLRGPAGAFSYGFCSPCIFLGASIPALYAGPRKGHLQRGILQGLCRTGPRVKSPGQGPKGLLRRGSLSAAPPSQSRSPPTLSAAPERAAPQGGKEEALSAPSVSCCCCCFRFCVSCEFSEPSRPVLLHPCRWSIPPDRPMEE